MNEELEVTGIKQELSRIDDEITKLLQDEDKLYRRLCALKQVELKAK